MKKRKMRFLLIHWVYLLVLIGAPMRGAGPGWHTGLSDWFSARPFLGSATRPEQSWSDLLEPDLMSQPSTRAGLPANLASTPIPSATPSTPIADIGETWTDRRPIGILMFAQIENISHKNLNGWMNGGPVNLGIAAFQRDILSRVKSTILNTLAMRGQGVLIWDIEGCGKTTPSLPSQQYLGDPRFLDPKGAGLTVRTSSGPYVPPTSKLGRQGLEPAMNAIADRVFNAIRAARLVSGICLRAEKVSVNAAGDLSGTAGDGELRYDTTPNQLADLDAKLTYAHDRWGCRIFYVDSNVAADDVISAQRTQLNPTWAPAWVYTQLRLRHPDCLICPEEWYPGAFSFPTLGIDDPAYQYSRTTVRYTELRNPWMVPFIHAAEAAVVPTAFTLINVADRGTRDPANQDNVVNALKKRQCILLSGAWSRSDGITLVINFQKAAHANGF
jgi:hypothetical protein